MISPFPLVIIEATDAELPNVPVVAFTVANVVVIDVVPEPVISPVNDIL